jgi:septum formation protein
MTRRIVLASTSRYRQDQLALLHLPFVADAPDVPEEALPGEGQRETAQRLAVAKAKAVSRRHADAIVIGADQVAELDGRSIGKPGTHEAALEQLLAMQGRTVLFHSGIAVVDGRTGRCLSDSVPTEVRFRSLPRKALDAYLRIDLPYDCAGSARIESLGICLVEAVHSEDPTALVGLPLIALTSMLAELGVALPAR